MKGLAARVAVAATLGLAGASCTDDPAAAPDNPTSAAPASSPSARASASASTALRPSAPPPPKVVDPVELSWAGVSPDQRPTVHTIDGAVMLSTKRRVGRLDDEGGIEWVGDLPKSDARPLIVGVYGKWPDLVAALTMNENSRAPDPAFVPLRGGGGFYAFGTGGSGGALYGVATSGETTTVAGRDLIEGPRIIKVRGPLKKPTLTRADEVGCPEPKGYLWGAKPAIEPSVYGATRAGTIVMLGEHCDRSRPAITIWDRGAEKGRIVLLEAWQKLHRLRNAKLLQGPDDTLYLVPPGDDPVFCFSDGALAPLPEPPHRRLLTFVSPAGTLYAHDGRTIFEWVDPAWVARVELLWPETAPFHVVRHRDRFLTSQRGKVYALREAPSIALDPKAETVSCAAPFVYLFAVDPLERRATFPETAKALSTFAMLDRTRLVTFGERGGRHVGIAAADWKAAQALWEHVARVMPDRDRRLLCYAPPKNALELEVTPASPAGSAKENAP